MTSPEESPPPRRRFLDRPTTDLLVLMVAFTICSAVVVGGGWIIAIEVIHPENDTTRGVVLVSDILNTLIGLLAGFLAGRTETVQIAMKREKEEEDKKP